MPACSVSDGDHSTRLPSQIKKYQKLRRQCRRTVQYNIFDCSGSRRDESLMPLVQTRDQHRHKKSNHGPTQSPGRSPRQTQRRTPGAKKKKTQGKVTHEMPAFPDVMMHHLEACRIQTHEEVKQRIKKSAGVLGGKRVGGFDCNQRHPQQRGNPRLEQLLMI